VVEDVADTLVDFFAGGDPPMGAGVGRPLPHAEREHSAVGDAAAHESGRVVRLTAVEEQDKLVLGVKGGQLRVAAGVPLFPGDPRILGGSDLVVPLSPGL
jgi:hypothetical protein